MKPGHVIVLMVVGMGSANASYGTQSGGRDILREQRQIREEVDSATGKYSRFRPEASAKLERAQHTIFELLGADADVSALDKDHKVELFNAVEVVRAVISDNDDDRLVCERERRLGSHMRQTQCATVAERRELREGARDFKGKPGVCSRIADVTGCGTQGG